LEQPAHSGINILVVPVHDGLVDQPWPAKIQGIRTRLRPLQSFEFDKTVAALGDKTQPFGDPKLEPEPSLPAAG
jgi:hypothetical protein